MLPYRLRPPTFASKEVKEKRQHESKEELMSGGGPIQRSMELDLLELRPLFLEKLSKTSSEQHECPGRVFGLFKEVFGLAKVALVHTRTVPPRVDRDAHAQLLYSACFSLMKQSCEAQQEITLNHAAYAIFCLYALYETNPLPDSTETPLQLLSMGLLDPENPRFLYRRCFRQPIRIDRYHYSLLQRVRDQALAQQADCQAQKMQCLLESNKSCSCTCGVAVDVVQIIDRLMASSCLDFSEYTGPRGLEALAGHAEYLYGCIRPKVNYSKTPEIAPATSHPLTDAQLDAIQEEPLEPLETSLKEHVDRYRTSLQNIRLAPASSSNQAARIRTVLQPIFDASPSQPTWQDMWNELSVTDGGSRDDSAATPNGSAPSTVSTRVLGSIAPTQPSIHVTGKEESAAADAQQNEGNTVPDISYELVLPSDVPDAQQEGIQAALNQLIASGEMLIEPPAVVAPPSVSTTNMADDTYSVAGSVYSNVTGQGRLALRTLMSAAAAAEQQPAVQRLPVSVIPQKRKATARQDLGSAFLTMNTQDDTLLESDHSEISSVSSSEESVESVAVGRTALRALLSAVDDGDGFTQSSSSKKGSRERKAPKPGQAKKPAGPQKPVASLKKPSEDSEDELLPNIRGSGRAALDALLSAVESDQGNEDGERKPMSKAWI